VRRSLVPLGGALVLAAFSVAALPFSRGLFRAPRTPFDAGDPWFTAPAWVLLSAAEPLIPAGASVLIRSEPPDPTADTYLHRYAVALLPGRTIIPAARWSVPMDPADTAKAQYEVVLGRPPGAVPSGRRLLRALPEGTIWRRDGGR
jgi:hypothetical protein